MNVQCRSSPTASVVMHQYDMQKRSKVVQVNILLTCDAMNLVCVADCMCMLIAGSASSSETGTPAATPHKESTASSGNKGEGYKYGTLSRVRKFRVDGEVIQSTTRRIVEMKANKTLRDNKRYQEMRYVSVSSRCVYIPSMSSRTLFITNIVQGAPDLSVILEYPRVS